MVLGMALKLSAVFEGVSCSPMAIAYKQNHIKDLQAQVSRLLGFMVLIKKVDSHILLVSKASPDEKAKMKAALEEYFTVENFCDQRLSLIDISALKKPVPTLVEAGASGDAHVVIFLDAVKDGIEDAELRDNFDKGSDLKLRELILEAISAERVFVDVMPRGFRVKVQLKELSLIHI